MFFESKALVDFAHVQYIALNVSMYCIDVCKHGCISLTSCFKTSYETCIYRLMTYIDWLFVKLGRIPKL